MICVFATLFADGGPWGIAEFGGERRLRSSWDGGFILSTVLVAAVMQLSATQLVAAAWGTLPPSRTRPRASETPLSRGQHTNPRVIPL